MTVPDEGRDELRIDCAGGVFILTMNRPQAHNALTSALSRAMAAALAEFERDDSALVGVLTGAGGSFCSGMDLKAFLDGESPMIGDRGLAGMTTTPPGKPMIAAVEGYALAGGFELALACDMIVASREAVFGLPEVTRSQVAGAGGVMRLPERIPRAIATEYILTGRHFSAEQASSWGLLNRMTEPGEALEAAVELAGQIARNGPLAVRACKRIITSASHWPAEDRWARQQEVAQRVFDSADAREGALAFAERRAPVWKGV